MRVIHRRIASAAATLLLSALLSAAAPRAGFADDDRDGPTEHSALFPVPPMTAPTTSPAPDRIPLSTDQTTEIDGFTASEPDPEAFDRRGIEIWWQRFQNKEGTPGVPDR